MLGIDDTWIALAYGLCMLSTLLSVVWGVVNWNRGDEAPLPEDVRWAREEKDAEEAQ
ncbi:MAG: hypothetical protein IT440_03055 [Phycisphaeraceae bacterium]|nr:hypothetical protein [Phycisphaeraceae bacterium]